MKKNVWAWIIGGALFAMVIGVWVWQLPNALRFANGGRDVSIGSVFSSFSETQKAMITDFAGASLQLDKNMQKIDQALTAQAAQAAAVDKLKQDLANEVAKKKIQAAMTKTQ
jgi:hypothetical protein